MRTSRPIISLMFTMVAGMASVSAVAETTWTMASGYPESSFLTQNIRLFIKDVETKSAGKLKIDLRSNDSLIKLDSIKRAVQAGQVQIGEIRLGVYGNEAAIYNLDNTPGVAVDYRQAMKLSDAQMPYLNQIFQKNGMQVLSLVPWPGQGFYTKKPINNVSDLDGLKLRIYSKQTQEMGEKLGMQALILPFAEVPQAFATGMIESLWTSAQTGVDVKAWENTKYFTYTGTMHNKNAIIVNRTALRRLDSALQKIVVDAGMAATARGFVMSEKAGEEREQVLQKNGITVSRAPADVMVEITKIGQGMIADWLAVANQQEKAVYETYLKSLTP